MTYKLHNKMKLKYHVKLYYNNIMLLSPLNIYSPRAHMAHNL